MNVKKFNANLRGEGYSKLTINIDFQSIPIKKNDTSCLISYNN